MGHIMYPENCAQFVCDHILYLETDYDIFFLLSGIHLIERDSSPTYLILSFTDPYVIQNFYAFLSSVEHR